MNTKRTLRLASLIAALALTVSVFGTASVSADSGPASYQYLIGSGLLCALNPDFCPDVAMADNGDTVEVAGSGTLSIHPASVSGGGTFTHKDSGGGVRAAGTWTATQLQSFNDYGTAPGFPAAFHAGEALIRVHLVVTSGPFTGAERDAILTVSCELAGAKVPGGHAEGIRLAIQDHLNFNQHVSGNTLYIKLP
jgi:hypothetical protein